MVLIFWIIALIFANETGMIDSDLIFEDTELSAWYLRSFRILLNTLIMSFDPYTI